MPFTLVEDNIAMIEQGRRLAASLPGDAFTARSPATLGASIGGHLRHNLDHYTCFLRGVADGRIDYDARQRDNGVESEPATACAALGAAAAGFAALDAAALDRDLEVRMDTGEGDTRPWTRSTVRRELQFLVSHTVHHYALIAMICGMHGHAVEAGFGVAPSTLEHRRRQSGQACAR